MVERRCFWEFSSGIGRGWDRMMCNLIGQNFLFLNV